MAAQPQADTVVEAIAEPSVALEELRAAILEDEEASDLPIFSRTGIFAGVIAVAVFAGAMWLWSGRTHKSEANVQASGSPSAEAPAEIPSPLNLPQNTSELASHPSAADASTLPSTLDVARRDDTTRPAVVRKPPESQRASRAQIVVGLNRFTRVNPKLLHNPDRIYFDLGPGTSPKLSKSSIGRATGSTLVRRIRIGHADDGHTRVVLDLERPCKYQAKVSRTPPYKLIINIRRAERGRRTS